MKAVLLKNYILRKGWNQREAGENLGHKQGVISKWLQRGDVIVNGCRYSYRGPVVEGATQWGVDELRDN